MHYSESSHSVCFDLCSVVHSSQLLTLCFFIYFMMDVRVDLAMLRKEELYFEIVMRDGTADMQSDVATLTITLRELLTSSKSIQNCSMERDDVIQQLQLCEDKYSEFLYTFHEFHENFPTSKQLRRILSRLLHWKQRVEYFGTSEFIDETKIRVSSLLQKFLDLIDKFSLISGMDSSKDIPNKLPVDISENIPDTIPNNIPGVPQNISSHDSQSLPLPINFAFQVKTACIPNPIEALINELKPMSVDNSDYVFEFLKIFVKFKKQVHSFGVTDMQIFQILIPYASGRLRDTLITALTSNWTLHQFHTSILNQLLPPAVLNNILSCNYFRSQKVYRIFYNLY